MSCQRQHRLIFNKSLDIPPGRPGWTYVCNHPPGYPQTPTPKPLLIVPHLPLFPKYPHKSPALLTSVVLLLQALLDRDQLRSESKGIFHRNSWGRHFPAARTSSIDPDIGQVG